MAENPEKQTAWKCRLDQYPPMILKPYFIQNVAQLTPCTLNFVTLFSIASQCYLFILGALYDWFQKVLVWLEGYRRAGGSPRAAWQPPMYKSNMAENPEKETAWECRLDQYPPMILNPISVMFPSSLRREFRRVRRLRVGWYANGRKTVFLDQKEDGTIGLNQVREAAKKVLFLEPLRGGGV